MSRFFHPALSALKPYSPGEQPQDKAYIKLNTNELPYPPPPGVAKAVTNASQRLNLYCDPTFAALRQKFAAHYAVQEDSVVFGNGSDELLSHCFMAFGQRGVAFADVTYGFYEVFAQLLNLPVRLIPLKEDLSVGFEDYAGLTEMVVIANPNAPTGLALSRDELECILKWNQNSVVLVDEAYVDFGAESCMPLCQSYDNLVVVGTFSKSRSLAGGRLGYAVANPALIADINRIRYSLNPYNVNAMTQVAGEASLADEKYFRKCVQKIVEVRQNTMARLREMGFTCTDSLANFVFARHEAKSGQELYLRLKEKGILVRWFDRERINEYLRISIGTAQEMHALCTALDEILAG